MPIPPGDYTSGYPLHAQRTLDPSIKLDGLPSEFAFLSAELCLLKADHVLPVALAQRPDRPFDTVHLLPIGLLQADAPDLDQRPVLGNPPLGLVLPADEELSFRSFQTLEE